MAFQWLFKKWKSKEDFFEMTNTDFSVEESKILVQEYAIYVITELIASVVSNIEFKTYGKNAEEQKKKQWIQLNLHPNVNQNATEFWMEVTTKLLRQEEVLIVQINDQLIIADNFNIKERAVKGYYFENVTRGGYKFKESKFKREDVVYLKYSNHSVRRIMDNIMSAYAELISVAENKYARSSEEKGILKISAKERGDPNFKERFEAIKEKEFKKFFSRGSRVLPLFEGYDYVSSTSESTKKYSNEITDVKTLFEDALTRVAQAYKVPPGLIRGDVAGVKDATTLMLTNCIDPIAHMISEEFTYQMHSEQQIIDGWAIEADTTCIKHIDIFDLASSIDKLIASGFLSIDEVRQKAGLRGLDTDWSRAHYMTLNYTTAESTVAVADDEAENADDNDSSEKADDNNQGGENNE